MFDILRWIPGTARKTPSGWYTFNAPCCIHNGESRDTRRRGGVIVEGDNWSYHCFNCGFKTRHELGKTLSYKSKKFLGWLGVDEETIQKYNLESIRNKKFTDIVDEREAQHNRALGNLHFKEHELPQGARLVSEHDKKFVNYIENVRGLALNSYDFYITPKARFRDKNRILIPYRYGNEIVGWTSRYLDDNKPKYKNEYQQDGYLFGTDLQQEDWKYVLAFEGIFDAISLHGIGLLHNEISDKQAAWLRRTGKEVVVVPDQDKSGLKIIEEAIEAGFSVSIPRWADHIKDGNDAIKHYGRAGTLLSILAAKSHSKIKIKVAVAELKKKIERNEQHDRV